MARTNIVPLNLPRAGALLTWSNPDLVNGNSFSVQAGDIILLEVYSPSAPIICTVRVPAKADIDLTIVDRVLSVGAGQSFVWVENRPDIYTQTDSTVWIDFSGSCSFVVFRVTY